MRNISAVIFLLLSLSSWSQIRVMTYNIRNSQAADGVNKWRHRRQALTDLILKVNPDILGTQEVRYKQLKDLQRMLGAYGVFGAGRNDGRHGGEHSTIFYKLEKYLPVAQGNFWLSETPDIPGSKSWDAAITRICTWVKLRDKQSGDEFFVFNTHLDHRGNEARRKSAALICKAIDSLCGNAAIILTGDFNFSPGNAGYGVIVSAANRVPLKDSYSPDAPDYTDCGFNVSNTSCHRIDYIFYSSHFISGNYTLHTDNNGTYYPSDHLTISVDLKKAF